MTEELWLQVQILAPALLSGMLVISTHVPMGQEVLRRGIIFLDLAIAQIAAFGLVLAGWFGIETQDEHNFEITQFIAISAAVLGAALLYQVRQASAKVQEALIGILFMLAATGSALLLSKDPHGGDRLKEILVGQILWVDYSDIVFTAIVYATVLLLWVRFRNKIGEFAFYPLFAITITLATQLVGVYLVFASLIIPALSSFGSKRPLLVAYTVGFLGYASGLIISAYYDLPSGSLIPWCLAAIAAGHYGLVRLRSKKLATGPA